MSLVICPALRVQRTVDRAEARSWLNDSSSTPWVFPAPARSVKAATRASSYVLLSCPYLPDVVDSPWTEIRPPVVKRTYRRSVRIRDSAG